MFLTFYVVIYQSKKLLLNSLTMSIVHDVPLRLIAFKNVDSSANILISKSRIRNLFYSCQNAKI